MALVQSLQTIVRGTPCRVALTLATAVLPKHFAHAGVSAKLSIDDLVESDRGIGVTDIGCASPPGPSLLQVLLLLEQDGKVEGGTLIAGLARAPAVCLRLYEAGESRPSNLRPPRSGCRSLTTPGSKDHVGVCYSAGLHEWGLRAELITRSIASAASRASSGATRV